MKLQKKYSKSDQQPDIADPGKSATFVGFRHNVRYK